jgi:hypothetical protein
VCVQKRKHILPGRRGEQEELQECGRGFIETIPVLDAYIHGKAASCGHFEAGMGGKVAQWYMAVGQKQLS